PDLGPSKLLVAARRAQMRTAPPSPARVVRVVLARAETWSVTRPIAHLGRLGWSQLRTARKR
ncbi:MAG TPA: hypothetical protein VGP46_10585, partial [Acidimicrobiales bacterium]|nr:hypothetical protein [Acidimicrobiales bacterium]